MKAFAGLLIKTTTQQTLPFITGFSAFKMLNLCTSHLYPRPQIDSLEWLFNVYSNKLSDKITKLNVGNERVIAFELDLGQKYCFINTYMPTNKKDSEFSYRECLDVLHDIISRFESSHKIVLCGDLNGTLMLTRNNKHDIMLKDFVKEHTRPSSPVRQVRQAPDHFFGRICYPPYHFFCRFSRFCRACDLIPSKVPRFID